MTPGRKLRTAFGFTVLLAAGALLLFAEGHGMRSLTEATNEGDPTAMSLVIEGTFGGPVTCDSSDVAMCSLSDGSAFTVMIVPTTIPVGGYYGFQTYLEYGVLQYEPLLTAEREISWDLSFLPLRAPQDPDGTEGFVGHGDISSFGAPWRHSSQKTVLMTLQFRCTSSDTLRMLAFDMDARPDGTVFFSDYDADNEYPIPEVPSLEINCTEPPTPTRTDTPGPPTSTPTPTYTPTQTDTPTQTATPKPCGDADGNGRVESLDSLRVLQFDAGLVPSVPSEGAADVNTDGRINSVDATLILQVVAGLSSGLTC